MLCLEQKKNYKLKCLNLQFLSFLTLKTDEKYNEQIKKANIIINGNKKSPS